jgi:hypothetical protein
VSIGRETLRRTPELNRELERVLVELEELVDEPATKTSLVRLGQFFDEAADAGNEIVPYQTVCNYWNYWFTYLTEHFAQQDAFGSAERLILTGAPGVTSPEHWPRNPIDNYAGSQADGRLSDIYAGPQPVQDLTELLTGEPVSAGPKAGEFQPDVIPILHGNPYGPAGTEEAPNCQGGQVGYAKGEALSPGQGADNPSFGVNNISAAAGVPPLGRTDLFLRQDGTRVFWEDE